MLSRTLPAIARALALALVAGACRDPQTAPHRPTQPPLRRAATAADESGPPSPHAFGPDSYRTGLFTGAGTSRTGLRCRRSATARSCEGYLASGVDGTLLDVTLQLPHGSGPFPLVALLHGWAGSKGGDGDIAATLVGDGYAVLRYSARGFGESWGQANLADRHVELRDLRSLIGQLVDEPRYHLDADAVAVTGASYGGGQSWLALLQPTFTSPAGQQVRIRTVVPIAPWTDLLYSLLPNGRERDATDGLGALKLTYVNGLYASGLRKSPDRPYPSYPDYLVAWHTWLNAVEPNDVDPVYRQVRDGLAGGRSIWWQGRFWAGIAQHPVPVLDVQGFTDDLFPLPEAARMARALRALNPDYPITLYLGDVGHPRARNKPDEVAYALALVRRWLAWYLKGEGSEPAHVVYAAITRPPSQPFSASDVITVPTVDALATDTVVRRFDGATVLTNPSDDPLAGFFWDPFVIVGAEELRPYLDVAPVAPLVETSLATYDIDAASLGAPALVAGAPSVRLTATTTAPRVQLDIRVIDIARDGTRQLVTRGTYTLVRGPLADPTVRLTIPSYGNLFPIAAGDVLRIELSNIDSPYLTPSRIPSATAVTGVEVRVPVRR